MRPAPRTSPFSLASACCIGPYCSPVRGSWRAELEADLMRLVGELSRPAPRFGEAALVRAMHTVAREARTIEGRLSKGDWIVGDAPSAADIAIFPCIRVLHRALLQPGARELAS